MPIAGYKLRNRKTEEGQCHATDEKDDKKLLEN